MLPKVDFGRAETFLSFFTGVLSAGGGEGGAMAALRCDTIKLTRTKFLASDIALSHLLFDANPLIDFDEIDVKSSAFREDSLQFAVSVSNNNNFAWNSNVAADTFLF